MTRPLNINELLGNFRTRAKELEVENVELEGRLHSLRVECASLRAVIGNHESSIPVFRTHPLTVIAAERITQHNESAFDAQDAMSAQGWVNPDGTGTLYWHPSVLGPDGKPQVMHSETAVEIQKAWESFPQTKPEPGIEEEAS